MDEKHGEIFYQKRRGMWTFMTRNHVQKHSGASKYGAIRVRTRRGGERRSDGWSSLTWLELTGLAEPYNGLTPRSSRCLSSSPAFDRSGASSVPPSLRQPRRIWRILPAPPVLNSSHSPRQIPRSCRRWRQTEMTAFLATATRGFECYSPCRRPRG